MSKQSAASSLNLRMTVYSALFTALIIIGGYISIPIGPVPIVLADFFVMLAGLFLGYRWGLASVLLFLFLGALGLPVFAGGKAGLAVFMGPTAGYLPGYVLLVLAAGLLCDRGKPISDQAGPIYSQEEPQTARNPAASIFSVLRNTLALILGNILMYASGVSVLKIYLSASWEAALAAGLIPFLPGVLIKIAAAVALGQTLLPRFRQSVRDASWQPERDEDGDEM